MDDNACTDPCDGVTCGVNEECNAGFCGCVADHHDHDGRACHSTGTVHDASCGTDEIGTPPNCTSCGAGEVPNSAGTACEVCPTGQTETTPGTCSESHGHCTSRGAHSPGDERYCVAAGRVFTNGQCPRTTCPDNSTDNGGGVCDCDPGYVYTVPTGALYGPWRCTERTAVLCGTVADPGTCGSGGAWNSGTATCDCADGYEQSGDGQACVCPPASDDSQSLGHQPSVLHPNPQSLFDGLQVGFVNTTAGNLTFRRRDIVTRSQGPVVFARVYDSRIGANDDFGPGWRLSLAEELHVDGDVVTYIDESGARQTFAWDGTGYVTNPSMPRHDGTALSFADVDGTRAATLMNGDTTRTFVQADAAGTRYVLGTVRTASRELVFDYHEGRLVAVSHAGATLFAIDRDADGRIVEVRDNHGRSVRYTYDFDGRLTTVRDIADSDWSYTYRGGGRLGAATDPDGRAYLAATYDADGRVAQSFSGRLYSYAYADVSTTVTEDGGETYTLGRNAAGVTTALSSTDGVSWRLTLDAANRVTTLTLPERVTSYTYDSRGRVATATVADALAGATSMQSHAYDARGRLTGIAGAGRTVTVTYAEGHVHVDDGDETFEYHLDTNGRVTSVRQGTDPSIWAERDSEGDIVALWQGNRTVRFGRDALGRIVDRAYADDRSARYFYDELGNRQLAEHGDGSSVVYTHDAAGSVVGVETTDYDGAIQRPTVALDTAELVERTASDGALTLGVDYRTTEYGSSGVVGQVTTKSSGAELVALREEPPEPASAEKRLKVLMRDGGRDSGPEYGVVAFDGLGAIGLDTVVAGVPRLRDARALMEVATEAIGDVAAGRFEMDPVFRPMEYTAVAGRRVTAETDLPSAACEGGYVVPDFVDNDVEASLHYFQGGGETVGLGPESQASIRQSERQRLAERRLREGTSEDPTSGRYGVTSSKTFINNTVVTYETTCDDSTCTTVFQGAVDDGYWDVNVLVPESMHDGKGDNAEIAGGEPYAFETFSWEITYPNPDGAGD